MQILHIAFLVELFLLEYRIDMASNDTDITIKQLWKLFCQKTKRPVPIRSVFRFRTYPKKAYWSFWELELSLLFLLFWEFLFWEFLPPWQFWLFLLFWLDIAFLSFLGDRFWKGRKFRTFQIIRSPLHEILLAQGSFLCIQIINLRKMLEKWGKKRYNN